MKKLVFILVLLFIICGCDKDNSDKFYLSDKYYGDGEYIKVKSNSIKKNSHDSYVLFTYNNYCSLAVPCEDVFEDFMKDNNIDFLSIPFEDFKDTYLYDTIKYGPSVVIVNNGKIVAYLDANDDVDLEKYQDVDKFKEWISEYIYLESSVQFYD